MSLTREDVAPLARRIGQATDRLGKLKAHVENLDMHPAWSGEQVKEVARDLRLLGDEIRYLKDWKP